ncbi:MAG: hypothetical protein EOO52_17840 [Gammaproteobacteria bacterium]|nr:MAG: hypothetical protein EOO52_17840 [Gammaproteobacteria bacterium]
MNELKKYAILLALLLTACEDKVTQSSSTLTANTNSATTSIITDTWLGKWNGVEGTFIDISGGNGTYTITISDLDGPKQYQGSSKNNQITFERNGITETIQPTDGPGTGMKWLSDKSNCLRVREGEGWCRD